MLQQACMQRGGTTYTWLQVINAVIQMHFPGRFVSLEAQDTRLPVAAMMSVPGGPDQGWHRGYDLQTVYDWMDKGKEVPMFSIMALTRETMLKIVPKSHKPGASFGIPNKKFMAMTPEAQADHLNTIAVMVIIKVGELTLVDGRILHAGVGYDSLNVRIHMYVSSHPVRSNESDFHPVPLLTAAKRKKIAAEQAQNEAVTTAGVHDGELVLAPTRSRRAKKLPSALSKKVEEVLADMEDQDYVRVRFRLNLARWVHY